jgi:hypothetical protein
MRNSHTVNARKFAQELTNRINAVSYSKYTCDYYYRTPELFKIITDQERLLVVRQRSFPRSEVFTVKLLSYGELSIAGELILDRNKGIDWNKLIAIIAKRLDGHNIRVEDSTDV